MRFLGYILLAASWVLILGAVPEPKNKPKIHPKCYSSETGKIMRVLYSCP